MIDFSKVPPPSEWAVGRVCFEPDPPTKLPTGPAPPPPGQHFDTDAASMPDPGSIVDLDIPGAKRALAIFNDQIAHWEAEAAALVVNSPESAANATEMIGQVKRLQSLIDGRRKEIIAEPDKFVRLINSSVKPMTDRLKALEAVVLKRKLADYQMRETLERRRIEKAQEEARQRLQAELDKEAKAKGVAPVTVAPVAVPTKQGPIRSESSVTSTVMVWRHEVIDPQLVPRQYLTVDETAIKAAIRGGIREIPGVRIFEDAEIRTRRTA